MWAAAVTLLLLTPGGSLVRSTFGLRFGPWQLGRSESDRADLVVEQQVAAASPWTDATTSMASSTTRSALQEPADGKPKCLITQRGADGMGHQLEAKLSCIAVAKYLSKDFRYVHVPFHHLAHRGHATQKTLEALQMEKFLGLGELFRNFEWKSKELELQRIEVVWVGQCHKTGWIRKVELGQVSCKNDNKTLYWLADCWERFYCYGFTESGYWYTILPTIQQAYYSTAKPDPDWLEGMSSGPWGPKVVVHIRRGDGSYLPDAWYLKQINALRSRFAAGPPPLFRIQTDAIYLDKLLERTPEFKANDIAIDGRNSSFPLTFHRMVVADALVMSKSALSMSAGLIGNQSITILPACWDRTPLPHWTMAKC